MSAVWIWYKHKLGLHFVTSTPTALPHQAVECMLQCMNLWQSAFLVISIYGETSIGYLGDGGVGVKFWENMENWPQIFWKIGDWLTQGARKWEKSGNTQKHLVGSREISLVIYCKKYTKLRGISVVWVEKCIKWQFLWPPLHA